MKNKQTGITLIALVITIVLLLILAGIAINMVKGDNGIFSRANQASKETNYKQARETVELALLSARIEYSLNKNINVKEYVEKENGEITVNQTGTGEPLDTWDMVCNGWVFGVENFTIISESEGKINASIKNLVIIEEYQFATSAGNKVQVEFEVELEELEGVTVEVAPKITGAGIVDGEYSDGKYIGTITTNGIENPNGQYKYEIKITKDGTVKTMTAIACVEKFLDDPIIEITDITNDGLKINVTSNYPTDAGIKYKYYYSINETFEEVEFEDSKIKDLTGLLTDTTYNIKVQAYLSDGRTFKEIEKQATTEAEIIDIESLSSDNEIYIIKDGKENLVPWYLYNPYGTYAVSYNDGYLTYGGGNPYTYSNYHVNGKIDLTNFSKIVIEASCNYVGGAADMYYVSTSQFTTGFEQGNTEGLVKYANVTEQSKKIYEIDVSELNDAYYIGMSESYYLLNVYNVYLVKEATTEVEIIDIESLSSDNEIYIIKDGKENLVSWYHYNPSGTQTVSYYDGYLTYGGGNPYTEGNYHVNGKIDLTNFSKIIIEASCNYVNGAADMYYVSTSQFTTGFNEAVNTEGLVKYANVTEQSKKIYEIDVSELNDAYYIGMSNSYYSLNVFNLYLVKK